MWESGEVAVVKGGSVSGVPVLVTWASREEAVLFWHCLSRVCVLITSSFYRFWFRFLFVCVLRSPLRQLQALNGGKGRQQLQPLWDPLSPSCEGAVARATPRTGPRPHPKSSLSSKKRVENVEVKGHCCSCRPGSLPGRSRFVVPWSRELCILLHLCGDPEKSRKGGITDGVWSPKGGLSRGSG